MPFSPPAEFASVDNILILVVVVLLVFGSTQIPKLARSLGSAQKEFKKGLDEGASEDPKPATAEVAAPAVAPAVAQAPAPAPAPAPPVAQAPPAADGTPGAPS
jgi:sec-independent protein translocase protein TatA